MLQGLEPMRLVGLGQQPSFPVTIDQAVQSLIVIRRNLIEVELSHERPVSC